MKSINFKLFLISFFLTLILFTFSSKARREVPESHLALPVLISLNNGSGTGFYFQTGVKHYLVTAKHVLFSVLDNKLKSDEIILTSYPSVGDTGRYKLKVDLKTALKRNELRYHPTRDVAVLRLSSDSTDSLDQDKSYFANYITIIEKTDAAIIFAKKPEAKLYKDVLISNEVFVYGYPLAIGLKTASYFDKERPLLRKGIVAGINDINKTIIIDCPGYGGNSGSPVIEVDNTYKGTVYFKLIGIVSKFIPYAETWINISHGYENVRISNSGYTVVEPVDFLYELLPE